MGDPLPDARATLEDLGLEADEVDVDDDRTVMFAGNWEVGSQSPEPGTTIETGGTVTLNGFRPQDRDDGAMPGEEVVERADCIEVEYDPPESNTAYCTLEGPVPRLVVVRTFASERMQELWADEVEDDGTFMVEFSACELWAIAVQDGEYETELDFLEQADTEC